MKLRLPTVLPIDPFGTPDRGYATCRVTSPFGWRNGVFHGALDIGNGRLGDVLVSAADGEVIAVGNLGWPWSEPTTRFPSGNYGGLMAVIRSSNGLIQIFAHMRMTAVKVGQRVTAGQKVGEIGDTGSAAPPPLGGGGHVHYGTQMPLALVPAGVNWRATAFGIGIDVDPWPLITGAVEIGAPQEVSTVRYSGSQLTVLKGAAAFSLSVSSHFRAGATRQSDSLKVFPAGTLVYPSISVDGEDIGGNDQWAPCFMYTGSGYESGYFHTSVLAAPPVASVTEADLEDAAEAGRQAGWRAGYDAGQDSVLTAAKTEAAKAPPPAP